MNALVRAVLVGAQQHVGSHFVGIDLEGSLVSEDFDQDSDIDFVVVSDHALSAEQFAAWQRMHDRVATTPSWYADQIEGVYVTRQSLDRYAPTHARSAIIERGPGERLRREHLGSW